MTAAELRIWRKRRGLQIRELTWLHGIPVSTLNGKLSSKHPPRLDTERIVEMVDLLLHAGIRPPGWPQRLRHRIQQNTIAAPADALAP
jgi:hypothetical protein